MPSAQALAKLEPLPDIREDASYPEMTGMPTI